MTTTLRHLCCLLLLCLTLPVVRADAALPADARVLSDRLVVAVRGADAGVEGESVAPDLRLVRLPRDRSGRREELATAMARLAARPGVRYVEPVYLGRFAETLPAQPNDPEYRDQWWLPAVQDRDTWALSSGHGVKVAVIDSGVQQEHPDLAANLLPGGWNFGDGNDDPEDLLGHGTAVAGVIAAVQNNRLGVSGLAPAARILPIKINAGFQNSFTSVALVQGIHHAIDAGVDVINLSLTVSDTPEIVREAIARALDAGIVVVVAAGNDGGPVSFPASMAGVIAVASVDEGGELFFRSNRGPEVTVAAPGVRILSTDIGSGYFARTGTSLATPVVSALVANLLAINPTLSRDTLTAAMRTAARPLEGQPFGALNAGAAAYRLVPLLTPLLDGGDILAEFRLPPTGTLSVDVYVALRTASGSFALTPSGGWQDAARQGYVPVASGYAGADWLEGLLFGAIFPAIASDGLPAGEYGFQVALVGPDGLLGPVIERRLELP